MTRTHPDYRTTPDEQYTLGGLVVFFLLPFALLLLLSYPVLVIGALAGTLAAGVLTQRLARVYVNRIKNSTRTLTIPGIGEVTYRIKPN